MAHSDALETQIYKKQVFLFPAFWVSTVYMCEKNTKQIQTC